MNKMINEIFNKYEVSESDRKTIMEIIYPIISHEEFIVRSDYRSFPHHDAVSLGEHIISVAIVSYLIAKKKYKNEDIAELCTIIAMFHDLYELPWQNSGVRKNNFFNKHGFVHPIESVINAVTWYPEHFKDLNKSKLIIDSIIHHMYPFPSRIVDNIDDLELNNKDKFDNLDESIKDIIVASSNRHKIGPISFCNSFYKIGSIVSCADKKVTFSKDLKLTKLLTLVTGVNKDLDNYKK